MRLFGTDSNERLLGLPLRSHGSNEFHHTKHKCIALLGRKIRLAF